jgi:formylmethanofuran:tetrahydromethanopterin formyltransferase
MIEKPATVVINTISDNKQKQDIVYRIETIKESSDTDQTLSARTLYTIDLTADDIESIEHKLLLLRHFREVNNE